MSEYLKNNLFFTVLASLFIFTVFSLGFFTANMVNIHKSPIVVEKLSDELYSTSKNEIIQELEGSVVGSINSDKYHFEHCPGARNIKEENRVYFESLQEAELAGYTLAGNCSI